MSYLFKFLQRASRFFLKLIRINYKKHHIFQNKNQVTNMNIVLSLLQTKISPDFIFDIGCGHGEWFLKAHKTFPSSNYVLFDANFQNEDKLIQLKNKYPKISYKICLLSNKIEKLKFFNMGYGSSVYEENTNFERKVEYITSNTLENELSTMNINSNNNIIKLDVQGSELDILRGLKESIYLFEVIILETSVKEYNKNSPLFIDIINFMDKKDYIFYDICDLKRLGKKESFLVQFDSIFVRKNSKLLNFNFV